jgi:lipopolysaccharide/colanic/teichoic acid biosynthesis glycosyltransferase
MIPVVIILLLTGEHYVFYLQDRIGKGGRTFKIIKFATMMKNSVNIGSGEITLKKDPRVFPFGSFLRKSKINEIPQLLNILIGQMTIVGPRPLTPKHFNYYSDQTKETIGKLKPGLTGIASIVFRDEEALFDKSGMDHEAFYQKFLSPKKGELEQWYFNNQSVVTDLKLMFCTAVVILNSDSNITYSLFKSLPRVLEK